MSAREPGWNEIVGKVLKDVWDNANNLLRVGISAGTQLIGKVAIDQTTPGTTNGVQVNAALPTGANVIGGTLDAGPGAGAGILKAPQHGDMSAGTTELTAAPTGGQKWVITDIFISTAAAAEVSLLEETSNTVVFGPILMPANGYAQFTPRSKLKLATADKKVLGKSSTTDHVTIQVGVVSEA